MDSSWSQTTIPNHQPLVSCCQCQPQTKCLKSGSSSRDSDSETWMKKDGEVALPLLSGKTWGIHHGFQETLENMIKHAVFLGGKKRLLKELADQKFKLKDFLKVFLEDDVLPLICLVVYVFWILPW